jgi:hypothetical protein
MREIELDCAQLSIRCGSLRVADEHGCPDIAQWWTRYLNGGDHARMSIGRDNVPGLLMIRDRHFLTTIILDAKGREVAHEDGGKTALWPIADTAPGLSKRLVMETNMPSGIDRYRQFCRSDSRTRQREVYAVLHWPLRFMQPRNSLYPRFRASASPARPRDCVHRAGRG